MPAAANAALSAAQTAMCGSAEELNMMMPKNPASTRRKGSIGVNTQMTAARRPSASQPYQ